VVSAAAALKHGIASLLLLAIACGGEPAAKDSTDYAHVLPFDAARIRIATSSDTTALTVELAESQEQQTLGLMERRALGENAGMLFLYSSTQPETSAFWMFRTRIPLDIAFIDSAGVIRTIHTMEPCASPLAQGCPNYPAGAPYRAALETNAGFFERHGIRVGDRVLLGDTAERRLGH
jgi:uncharacterized membrane protein (UPF0127 family)